MTLNLSQVWFSWLYCGDDGDDGDDDGGGGDKTTCLLSR